MLGSKPTCFTVPSLNRLVIPSRKGIFKGAIVLIFPQENQNNRSLNIPSSSSRSERDENKFI